MTETEDALRQRIADLEAQLAAQPFIPALPVEHDGEGLQELLALVVGALS